MKISQEFLRENEELKMWVEKASDAIKVIWEIVKKAVSKLKEIFDACLDDLCDAKPRQRYTLLKNSGIKNYTVFFKRDIIQRCRSNC